MAASEQLFATLVAGESGRVLAPQAGGDGSQRQYYATVVLVTDNCYGGVVFTMKGR